MNKKRQLQIHKILPELLKTRGLSVSKAAKLAAIPPSTVAAWTSGTTPKDPIATASLADVLGVSINYLLFGESDPAESKLQEQPKSAILLDGVYRIKLERLDDPTKKNGAT